MKIAYDIHASLNSDSFTNSRTALAKLLRVQGYQIADFKKDLELINYQTLPLYPDYLTSLSHTRGAGAALLAKKKDYHSLGIDIEWSDRIMKPESQKFFRHKLDMTTENLLELWTMKEAAFKALSPLGHPEVLVLSKIVIQNGKFWTLERQDIIGSIETFKFQINNRELCLSLAFIAK